MRLCSSCTDVSHGSHWSSAWCHRVLVPLSQDGHPAPEAQGPQVIRFQRAATPLGAGSMAVSAVAAAIAPPSPPAEALPASAAVAEGVSPERRMLPLSQPLPQDVMHPAQHSSGTARSVTSRAVQPAGVVSDTSAAAVIALAACPAPQPSRLAAMLALQQAPPPRRPAPKQPMAPVAEAAVLLQQPLPAAQPPLQPYTAAPAIPASVQSPGPPQAMSSPALQPAPPAREPEWGSGWAAAPGLSVGPVADQSGAIAAAQPPSSALPQLSEAAVAASQASALGQVAQRLPGAADGVQNLGAGPPAAAPAPGVQSSVPQTTLSAPLPTQLPAQLPQLTPPARRTLQQPARKRRRGLSLTSTAQPGELVAEAGRATFHNAHSSMCVAVYAWCIVQPQAIGGSDIFC